MDEYFIKNYAFMAQYNRWMNERLYDTCEQLGDAERKRDRSAFFGSIHNTLNHLVLADQGWLRRFAREGVAFTALPDTLFALPETYSLDLVLYDNWADLRAKRAQLDAAIEQWVTQMPPDFPMHTMHYANSKGVQRVHPAWQAITHFFNHQTHHRGQVTTLLMQAGVDPGVTDLIALV
jgi:uncharacterized damage-inducible protein DinB